MPASATVGDWDGAAAITAADGVVGRLVHDVSGRDHDARLVNGPTSRDGCEVGLHGPRLPVGPDQYAAIHLRRRPCQRRLAADDRLEVAGDTPSGVYAGRLRTDDSEHYVVFYVRPPAAPKRTWRC